MQTSFERTITNELGSLGNLMNASTNFLEDNGVDAQAVYRINLALEEMVTNIIKHGYDDYEGHEIHVSLEVWEDEVVTILEDDGHEFNPVEYYKDVEKVPLEDRKIGGLGIHLIKKMLDRMDYRREDKKNILEIRTRRNMPAASA